MDEDFIYITREINNFHEIAAANLFASAFKEKFCSLWIFSKDIELVARVLHKSINYKNGIYAITKDSDILGFIALENDKERFVNVSFKTLSEVFGIAGAVWRFIAYIVYRIVHGKTARNEIHIDPIVVSPKAQGKGIGTRLLNEAFAYAAVEKKQKLVLEVVDTNSKAKKLYERVGFTVTKTDYTGYVTNAAGFNKIYHMEKKLL